MSDERRQGGLRIPWTVVAWILGLIEGAFLAVSICMVVFYSSLDWFLFGVLAAAGGMLMTLAWTIDK